MTTKSLPGEDIVDASLDALVRETCKEKAFSKWALLTRSTDRIRVALMSGASNVSADLAGTFHAGLRCGFRAISRLDVAGQLPDRPHFSDAQGASFYSLLKELDKYDQLSRLYALAHNGLTSVHKNGSRISFDLPAEFRPLEVFEIMDNSPPSVTSLLYFLNFLSADPHEYARLDPNACLESRILRSTTRGGRYRVRYQFDSGILSEFTEHFMPRAGVCPDDWSCAGLDWSYVKRFNASLMALAYYQTIATFGGGRLHRTVGGGDNQIVCIQSVQGLKSLIRSATTLPAEEVDALFEIYTYDEACSWADPALTPLIPLHEQRFALDPALVMLSNWERNTLKLLARGKAKEFDAVSSAFEKAMLSRISAALEPLGLSVRIGTTIAGEEIDLLAFDATAGVLLIVEAKWEIRASDPIEMVRARQAAAKKHVQLQRKVDALAQSMDSVAAVFGCRAPAIRRCVAAVVLDGNMGLPRNSTAYPVVPSGALDAAISTSTCLLEAFEALDTFSWAPKVGQQYELKELSTEFAGLTVMADGCRIMWENFGQYRGWWRRPHANLYGID